MNSRLAQIRHCVFKTWLRLRLCGLARYGFEGEAEIRRLRAFR